MDNFLIEDFEKAAVLDSIEKKLLPTPKGKLWEAIKSYYNLPEPEKKNDILSKIQLPPNWTVKVSDKDPSGRTCDIIDHTGVKVGSTFYKETFYDSFGSISFNEDQLKTLDIIV